MVFFSSILLGPYCVNRFFASASLRPSGDELNFFSTSGKGRVFSSSFGSGALGLDRDFGSGVSGFVSGFDSGALGCSAMAFILEILSVLANSTES